MNLCYALSDNMSAYRNLYYYLEVTFDGCEVSHISRASNEEADTLANIGSQCLPIPAAVFWEEITERSIKTSKSPSLRKNKEQPAMDSGVGPEGAQPNDAAEIKEVMMLEVTWMQPYLAYLINKKLPDDAVEVQRITRCSKAFVVVNNELYKKSISGVLQRCVTPQEGPAIIRDIHEGICGNHASSQEIAAKAFKG
jgi:hypothetical protein